MQDHDLQTLRVAGRLFPAVLSGEKTSTIRWREAIVTPGPMRFIDHDRPDESVVVRVIRCTDMPLSEAAAHVGRAAEWPDDVMLEGMREHYPEIELTEVVQVIEFDPPSSADGADGLPSTTFS